MDKSFHYLLMINQSIFQKKVINKLIDIGLTSGQPKILDYLGKHDGSMQKDIAIGCDTDQATLTGILSRMEEKGLIERKIKNGNKRCSFVYMTEEGKSKYKIVEKIFLELEENVFKGISTKERNEFMEIFYKICCNITNTEGLQ